MEERIKIAKIEWETPNLVVYGDIDSYTQTGKTVLKTMGMGDDFASIIQTVSNP